MPYHVNGFRGGLSPFNFGTQFRFYDDFITDIQAGVNSITDYSRNSGDSPYTTTVDPNHPGILRSLVTNNLQFRMGVGGNAVLPLNKWNSLYYEVMVRVTQFGGSWAITNLGMATANLHGVTWMFQTDTTVPNFNIPVAMKWCPAAFSASVGTILNPSDDATVADGSWFRLAWQWTKTLARVEFFVSKDQGAAKSVGIITTNLPITTLPGISGTFAYDQFNKVPGPPGEIQIDYVWIDGKLSRF